MTKTAIGILGRNQLAWCRANISEFANMEKIANFRKQKSAWQKSVAYEGAIAAVKNMELKVAK